MDRVTGIWRISSGSAIRRTGAWYRDHLGIDVGDWGGAVFPWGGHESAAGMTIWSAFAHDNDYMSPATQLHVNFRVADLDSLLQALRGEGCNVLAQAPESSEQGRFGWVIDPEGNKVELWQAAAGQ